MGLLQNGKWVDQWYDTDSNDGEFKRQDSVFRNWVTADGSAGPSGKSGFKAELGRYHLYVSLACPWAHRALIMRQLKGLQDIIPVTVVEPLMLENGWEFSDQHPDSLYKHDFLYELYLQADSQYEGRVTVPVLWDKKNNTIVNNESADIIRMLNVAFNDITDNHDDYYPQKLQDDIETINDQVYHNINNGVYKAGFATTQKAYETAVMELFTSLDWVEEKLSKHRYLVGDTLTEADIRLFTTLIRFDAVYVGHFKCNLRTIESYRHLPEYLRDLYQHLGVSKTVNFDHIKQHYYRSHKNINPTGIVPVGPDLDLDRPYQRKLIAE